MNKFGLFSILAIIGFMAFNLLGFLREGVAMAKVGNAIMAGVASTNDPLPMNLIVLMAIILGLLIILLLIIRFLINRK